MKCGLVREEIYRELAKIIYEKTNSPSYIINDELLALNENVQITLDTKAGNMKVVSRHRAKGKTQKEKSEVFELSDTEVFNKFREFIPDTKINKDKYDLNKQPAWVRELVGYLMDNYDICPNCGEPHRSGYVCDCGMDSSDCDRIFYPFNKYNIGGDYE